MKSLIIRIIGGLILVVIGIWLGTGFSGLDNSKTEPAASSHLSAKQKQQKWTCSMHPSVMLDRPGKCPICFMDLIPVKSGQASSNSMDADGLQLSSYAEKLAGVETAPVERRSVSKAIRMVGMVDYDESRIAHITARMPGRIDVLYVNYTGIAVRKGDHMVGYYSPDLYVAQKELLQSARALKRRPNISSGDDILANQSVNEQDILGSVIKRLHLWGLTDTNINTILKTGKVVDLVTLYAPISGIVIQKNAVEGKYFKTGDRLFTIADLSRVWIMLEAYESDIPWLYYGQKVQFTTASYPGKTFEGRISFIDPFLDPKTRTIKLRVDASNPDGKLKPAMFVDAIVYSKVSQGGKVIAPDLADKWISPMHPEIIKDKPGKCDICGMPLVKAESLGYVKAENLQLPLVIPASAPLITGKRAVVYINDKPGHYYGQEVVLGPRAGNYYVVEAGLKEGDKVVVNGNFKIDSALQIEAKPSMMGEPMPPLKTENSATSKPLVEKIKIPGMFEKNLQALYSAYFRIQDALAGDNISRTQAAAKEMAALSAKTHGMGIPPDAAKALHTLKKEMDASIANTTAAKDINKARESFSSLSSSVYSLIQQFGTAGKPVYRFHCPMAFDNKGAYWLQNNPDIKNPYFGAVMLKCGEKVEDIAK